MPISARYTPLIQNPYPTSFRTVSGFRYREKLVLARYPERIEMDDGRTSTYVVAEEYHVSFAVDGVERDLSVPKGMLTDLASVPRFARWIVGQVGRHLEAAIVHDFLFIAWQILPDGRPLKKDFRFANEVMYAAMEAAKVPSVDRLAVKTALRFPGIAWSVYQERDADLFIP